MPVARGSPEAIVPVEAPLQRSEMGATTAAPDPGLEARESWSRRPDDAGGSTRDIAGPAGQDPGARRRPSLGVAGLLLIGVLVLRIFYGMSLELRRGDDVQVYLLGLKFATTGQWPFFGPDVNHDTLTQVPGPLLGLLIGVPLLLTRQPEAPLIVLNVLSLTGLLVLGLYLARRSPLIPAWLTCAWLLTCPWTLDYSTHVYNPSYLLFPSCLFFVAFLELMPSLTGNLLPVRA